MRCRIRYRQTPKIRPSMSEEKEEREEGIRKKGGKDLGTT